MARGASMTKLAETIDSATGERRTVTLDGVLNKPTDSLDVVTIPIDTLESIALGFRMSMFELSDDDGNGIEVLSTGGLGGTTLILQFTDKDQKKQACVDCVDLSIRWVESFNPERAKQLRKAVANR